MRRISLALALSGAVAATGCGGSSNPASNGGSKGVSNGTFTVTVQNGQDGNAGLAIQGGYVTSSPAGIDCGIAPHTACSAPFTAGTTVALTATAVGTDPSFKDSSGNPLPYLFLGFAGDCQGDTCSLGGNADKYVVAMFAGQRTGHANLSDPKTHGPAWVAFVGNAPGALQCTSCHGANMQGQGIALSCATCHKWPLGHFDRGQTQAVNSHGAWSDYTNRINYYGTYCARCHTNDGFRDYLGVDGTAPNYLGTGSPIVYTGGLEALNADTAIAAGTPGPQATGFASGILKCDTCHTSLTTFATQNVTQITFKSNLQVTTDSKTALCGQCHQGYESSASVLAWGAGAATVDTVVATGNSFKNPHYLGAAATLFGGDAAGWVQYAGNTYTATNKHGGVGSCTYCHSPHTGDVKVTADTCGKCHNDEISGLPVQNFAQLEESRQFGFEGDIDGDAVQESIKAEIDGLAAKLLVGIQAYAKEVALTEIEYTSGYPYWMLKGTTTPYNQFTQRLQRAAVNYKWTQAEPGAWAHNPRYAIEVIYDSIADLNVALAPLGKQVPNGKRAFNGHFGAAEDPSPYAAMIYHGGSNAVTGEVLPTMGFTSDACYQCHGGKVGFETYLTNAPAAVPAGIQTTPGAKITAMQCGMCHTLTGADMKTIRSDVATVYFPPQKAGAADAGQVAVPAANLPSGFAVCATCHSGRENGASITKKIGATTDATWSLSVTNPHYLGAAGIMMGSNAAVMYQYAGNSYSGYPAFWSLTANGPHGSPHASKCTSCHNPKGTAHTFEIDLATTVPTGTWGGAYPVAGMQPGATNTAACNGCHAGTYSLLPIEEEYQAAAAELYAAIRAYAVANLAAIKTATGNANATGVCYWDAGVGGGQYYALEVDGVCQNGVAPAGSVPFTKANPKLLKGAFNYLWTQKEPAAWAHNEFYAMQVIYDSIVDLGGTPSFKVAAVTDAARVPVAGDPLNRGY